MPPHLAAASRRLRTGRFAAALLALAAIACAGSPARAEAPGTGSPAASSAPVAPAGPAPADTPDGKIPPRELPRYDGREPAPPSPGERALWVPRVLLFPLYVTSEYVIRKPVGLLVTTLEKYQIPVRLIDFFTFGEERQGLIVPTALADFGFRPSVGFYFRLHDAFVPGNQLRVHGGTWGEHWLHLIVADRLKLREDVHLTVRGEGRRAADHGFAGIGPTSRQADLSRYSTDVVEGMVKLEMRSLWRESQITASGGVRTLEFPEQVPCCDEPPLLDLVRSGALDAPPGFLTGYTVYRQRLEGVVDSRDSLSRSGTGFRAEAYGEIDFGLRDPVATRWTRWGGALGGSLDVLGPRRTLHLSATADFVDSLGTSPAPFTELVSLGGSGPLRGFVEGRLRGESGVAASIEYTWPAWVWLEGTMHASVGNVFDRHLRGFEPGLLRASFGVGVRTKGLLDNTFEIMVAGGTDPFDLGGRVTAFRFMAGTAPRF